MSAHTVTVVRNDEGDLEDLIVTCGVLTGRHGWITCDKPHEVNGVNADEGPDRCDADQSWYDEEEFEFHGVMHEWRCEHGWTVPYGGCVVRDSDPDLDEFGNLPAGTYPADDDWDDHLCCLRRIP